MRLVALAALTACTAEAPQLPVEHAPPPATLTAPALVRGYPVTLRLSGLAWGSRATFVAGTNLTDPGVCPAALAPVCLDIAAPWVTLGEAVADRRGEASLTITVPPTAPARVELQAWTMTWGSFGASTSRVVATLDPADDPDHDGVSAGDEAAAGTDPTLADTDGDGLTDDAEGRSDPRLADTDGDGLDDREEAGLATDPRVPDTDGDGLSDADEVEVWRTDPLRADSDGDGRSDAEEVAPTTLVINELQAKNDSTVTDLSGAFLDWVELYNPTGAPISLSRVTLRIDGQAWTPPVGAVPPRGFIRLFTDEHTASPYTAPFALPAGGGQLALDVDGAEVDVAVWNQLGADTAIARVPDGGPWTLTARPTPAAPNQGSATSDPSDALFPLDHASVVEITLPPASRAALYADPYTEVEASLTWEGISFPRVGVHLKGRLGSFRTLDDKAAFKVDLNAYEDRRLRGLEALTLNNMVQDSTYTHEILTYALMRELGVPAPRAGYAQVYVDGELFGLYLNVETVDDTFLERWFGDGHGPMWEGSYGTDFTPGSVGSFEYDEGPDPEDTTPLHEVTDVLARTPNLANLRSLLQLVDMDEVLAEQAAEHLSYHWDGYYTSNNYRVYDDPTDGKIALLPWGTDQTWLSTLDVYGGSGALFTWCLRVPACHAQYDNHLRLAAAAVGAIDLEGQLDDLVDYLTPNVPLDARGHRDLGWFQGDVDRTRDTLHNHPGEVLTRLELHCTGRNDPPGCYLCDTTAFGAMCRQPVDWYTADRVCRDFGMRLVMPKTDVLNTALSQVTAPYGQHWIGLSDEANEGRYRWVDGSTAAFTAWWSGEPNNCCGGEDCIGTNFGDVGRWNDYSCTTQLPFACQRAP